MELLNMLLSDWVGRLALFTVLFCIGMLTYLTIYFVRKILKVGEEASVEQASGDDHTVPRT